MPESNKAGRAGRFLVWVKSHPWQIAVSLAGLAAAFAGTFLIAWGVSLMSHTQASASMVFSLPVFWALLALSLWFIVAGAVFIILLERKNTALRLAYVAGGFASVVGLAYFTSWGIFSGIWAVSRDWIMRTPLFWGLLLVIGTTYAGILLVITKVHGTFK